MIMHKSVTENHLSSQSSNFCSLLDFSIMNKVFRDKQMIDVL